MTEGLFDFDPPVSPECAASDHGNCTQASCSCGCGHRPLARPYTQRGAPSAGYARGASTSEATEPVRAGAQREVMLLLRDAAFAGLTGHEANDGIGKPRQTTGQSALSTLHLAGHVERLVQTRNNQKVYVLPEYLSGRPTEERGRHGATSCPHCGGEL